MATWGSLGGAWQHVSGAPDGARVSPKLFEAFGADVKVGDDVAFGNGSLTDTSALAEEVPRVFSMKARDGFGGDLDLQGASLGAGLVGAGVGPTSMASASTLPYGDPCWVTVFGFPARLSPLVRQHFELICGPIVETCHGDGNFMHLRFHSATAANACLARNGHAVLGTLLVGCVPCTSGLVGIKGLDEGEKEPSARGWADAGAGGGWRPAPVVSSAGPQVKRGGLFWRLLDLIFDL